MKNPLSNLSRPKALGLAGVAAGVLAISGSAAAINIGLLGSGASEPFTPQKVSTTETVPSTVTTGAPAPEVVYQDVYEHVSGAPAPAGPSASSPSSSPRSSAPEVQSDDSHDSTNADGTDVNADDDQSDDQMSDDDHADDQDQHAEDSDHEVEHEDAGADD